MSDALEVAVRELQHTYAEADAFAGLSDDERLPEILRSYTVDLAEDITTLTQLKSHYGDRAKEILDLIADAKRIKRTMEKDAFLREQAIKKHAEKATVEPTQAVKVSGSKIPNIKLPTFDGETTDDFRGFKEAFDETLKLEPDLSDVRKWLMLRSHLAGKALQMVKELPIAAESYSAGIEILTKYFGSKRKAILRMYYRIQILPNAEMETESLKMMHAQMEGILLSLKKLQKDPNEDDFLRAVVIGKFPHELIHALRVTDEMTLDTFRKLLGEYIQSRDCTIQQVTTVAAIQAATKAASSSSNVESANNTGLNGNGTKGYAKGIKGKPQHCNNASNTSSGGNPGKGFPPHQVKSSIIDKSNVAKQRRLYKCIFCSGEHWSDECPEVTTIDDRTAKLADRCQKCLRLAHPNADCTNWRGCAHCKEFTHNRSLCPKLFGSNGKLLLAKEDPTSAKNVSELTKFITAKLLIGDTSGNKQKSARAVIDTAAGHSLITAQLAEKLQLQSASNHSIRLTGMDNMPLAEGITAKKLQLIPPKMQPIEIIVYVVPKIVDDVQSTDVAEFKRRFPDCRDILMPPEGNGEQVELLLGYHALTKIVTLERSKRIHGLQLLSTIFGWIPFGDLPDEEDTNEKEDNSILLLREIDPVKLMCDLESIGLADFLQTETEEEMITLEKLHQTIQRINKNYQIEWPYRYDPPDLEDNFGLAMGRLVSLYKQLTATPSMLKAYHEIIREQVATDVIETVNAGKRPPKGRVHYLPHRGIVRLGKSTPIRMVFDAAAKLGKRARSLNDNIYKGGNWVNDLPGVLIRFRKYGVAVTSDIAKAFHQILIAPKDRDVV